MPNVLVSLVATQYFQALCVFIYRNKITMKLLLKEQLALHNMSMRELSIVSGVALSTISLVANGKQIPSLASLELMAKAMGIEIYDLFEHKHLEIQCPHCGKKFHINVDE